MKSQSFTAPAQQSFPLEALSFQEVFLQLNGYTGTAPSLADIRMSLQVNIGGKTETLFSAPIAPIALADNIGNHEFDTIGTKNNAFTVRLSQPVNMIQGENGQLEASVQGSDNAAATVTFGISGETDNAGLYIPLISVFSVNRTNDNQEWSGFDNVTKVCIVNDGTELGITNLSLGTDTKTREILNVPGMTAKLASQWGGAVTIPNYSFCVIDSPDNPLDGVNIAVTSDTNATVNTYVVVFHGRLNDIVRRRGNAIMAAQSSIKNAKFLAQ